MIYFGIPILSIGNLHSPNGLSICSTDILPLMKSEI